MQITQAARDAAASIEPDGKERDQILRGKRNGSAIVQTFQRAIDAEREACAAVADDHAAAWGLAHATPAIVIAAAIRSRTA